VRSLEKGRAMSTQRDGSNRAAVAALISGRIIYAVNWFSLAAVFSFIATELNVNIAALGLATSTFFVGIGLFQVPGGLLAAKIGPRLTAIFGTAVSSLAVLLTSFANDLLTIVILRFFVGMGMAFVFAPGVILMARLLRKGAEGLGVGLYNSAFSLGGIIGLSGWTVLAATIGWRASLAVGGLLGLSSSLLLMFFVPIDSRRLDFKVEVAHLKSVLVNKWLVILSIAMLGLQAGSTIFSSFAIDYLHNTLDIGVGEAGIVAALVSTFSLASSPFAGRVFDRSGNAKRLTLASGTLMVVGVGIAFFGSIYAAILAGILIGLASGTGFTFAFAAAREANRLDQEYETLAVSWVNSLQLVGNFGPPLLYSYFVIQYGYSNAWLSIALLSLILTLPLILKKPPR
jgi:MFS family permease